MREQPEFITDRLILRMLESTDDDALFRLRSNPIVNKYIARRSPINTKEMAVFIKNKKEDIERGKILYWGINKLKNQNLIGTICLWNFDHENSTAEIGYEQHPDFHGRGFMSEAIQRILDYGFYTLKLKAIEAFTNKQNKASLKLLKKFKFKHDPSRTDKGFPENIILIKTND